ncbi:MAG: MFS transporter [Spirochaetales bacterium]
MTRPSNAPDGTVRIGLLHILYFLSFGFGVPLFTLYFSTILSQAGVSSVNQIVGAAIFLYNAVGVLASPAAGYISDRFRIAEGILTIGAVGAMLAAVLLVIPGIVEGLSASAVSSLILGGAFVGGFFARPLVPLINTETLQFLHRIHGNTAEYGRFRMLGSAGFVLATASAGFLITATGNVATPIALHAAGFGILAMVAGFRSHARPQRVRLPIEHLKRDRAIRRFLVFSFFSSLGVNSAFLYTSLFLEEIGAGYIVTGLALGAAAAPEVPIMFFVGRLIRRFGVKPVIATGIAAQVLKLVLFSTFAGTPSTWIFILVSTLHGTGFALLYAGSVNYVESCSHPDLRATYQNLFAFVWGSAVAVGGPVSATILDLWSTPVLMLLYAVMLAIILCYFIVWVPRSGGQPAVVGAD